MTSTPRMATGVRRSLGKTTGRGFKTRRALRAPPQPQPRTSTKQFPYSVIWNLQFVEKGRFIRSGLFVLCQKPARKQELPTQKGVNDPRYNSPTVRESSS